MDSPQEILQLARYIVIGASSVVALIFVWAIRGRVPSSIRERYPARVVARSRTPFAEDWRLSIEPSDMPLFVKARFRRTILTIALVILIAYVPLVYGFLENAAQVWQCHIDAVSWSPTRSPTR